MRTPLAPLLLVLLLAALGGGPVPALDLPHCSQCSCFSSCAQTCLIEFRTEICDLWLCRDYPECEGAQESSTVSSFRVAENTESTGTCAAFPLNLENVVPTTTAGSSPELAATAGSRAARSLDQ